TADVAEAGSSARTLNGVDEDRDPDQEEHGEGEEVLGEGIRLEATEQIPGGGAHGLVLGALGEERCVASHPGVVAVLEGPGQTSELGIGGELGQEARREGAFAALRSFGGRR